MDCVGVVRYLVTHRLAGNVVPILAIYDYYVRGLSPSEIGHLYGVSKYAVRGYIQRARCSGVEELLKEVVPKVLRIDSIMLKINGLYYCMLCDGKPLTTLNEALAHIKYKHRPLINELVRVVLDGVKSHHVQAR